MSADRATVVPVFELDPDLLEGLEPGAARQARERGLARTARLPRGPWVPPADEDGRFGDYLGLLVLDGLLTRCVRLGTLSSPELLGAGDLLRPWQQDLELGTSTPATSEWRVLEPTRVAILDGRFAAQIAPVPTVFARLLERALERNRWLALQLAIAHLRRVDQRLLVLLWHLADRWGKVAPDGVHLPMRLTHAFLADLIGAQRPSVTLGLNELAAAGRLRREGPREWVLHPPAPQLEDIVKEPGSRRRTGFDG